MKTKMHVFIYC